MWKTMDEWREDTGPMNGTVILVLSPEGDRQLAEYSGRSQRWISEATREPLDWRPVAWSLIPEVPQELIQRNAAIQAMRDQLDANETKPLLLK